MAICCAGSIAWGGAHYSPSNTASVIAGAGQWSNGGPYSNSSTVAQPGRITHTYSGQVHNYAAFLNTFSLFPALDTDQDGLANEVDADNDGLQYAAELSGSAFTQAPRRH